MCQLYLGPQVALQLVIVTHSSCELRILFTCAGGQILLPSVRDRLFPLFPVFMLYLLYRCESGVDNLTSE